MGAFKRFGYGRETAEKNSLTHKNYTRAIVSSPEIVDIYAQAFGISNDKVIPVGTPRTDVFFDSDYVSSVKERLYKKQPLLKGKKFASSHRPSGGRMLMMPNIPRSLSISKNSRTVWATIGLLF